MMGDWQHIRTAPKDGRDILVCLPGGHSDHYFVVAWDARRERWACRWCDGMRLTELEIGRCYLQPMWMELSKPPSSLCEQGIVSDSPLRYDLAGAK